MKLRFTVVLFLFLTSCQSHLKSPKAQWRGKAAILQGLTTKNTTQIAMLLPNQEAMTYSVTEEHKNSSKAIKPQLETYFSPDKKWKMVHLQLSQLELNKKYRITVFERKESGLKQVIDQRYFKTLDIKKKEVYFAVASCMYDGMTSISSYIWDELHSFEPELIFMIGDNVYADVSNGKWGAADPKQLWKRFLETRLALPIFYKKNLTPTLGVRDDHDYGKNNGDRTYSHKKASNKIFSIFFPQKNITSAYKKGPGLAGTYKAFGQQFYLLDNRSYRTPNKSKQKNQTHWGHQQEHWLFRHLKQDHQPAWLIQGDQFFGGYQPYESYEGDHPVNFKKIIKKLGQSKAPIVFLSGDRHLTEVMKISKPDMPYTTYEFTSSGIHAKLYPGRWNSQPNPRQVVAHDLKYNYMLIRSKAVDKGLNLEVKAVGSHKKTLYSQQLQVRR